MAASLMTSGGLERPDPATALIRIALQLGATSVAHLDVEAMLSGVCVALPPAAAAHGAALVLDEPADPRAPDARRVFSSDTAADRLALIQQRAANGPIPAAIRGDRTLATPDLTRGGPPELAAAAADCGLVRSLVVPVPIAGRTAGGLQLLGRSDAVLGEQLATLLGPVVTMLAARLTDVRELARLEALAGEPPAGAVPEQNGARAEPGDAGPDAPRTPAFPRVPAQRQDDPRPSAGPWPNGQEPSRRPRHRRPDDD